MLELRSNDRSSEYGSQQMQNEIPSQAKKTASFDHGDSIVQSFAPWNS
jgi:hypothetical protein